MASLDALVWRKSSYTANNNACVEVAMTDIVQVRDSKDSDGERISVPALSWHSFLSHIK
jgi:hypothetical protein